MVHVVVTRPWPSEPALSSERRAIATTFVRTVPARPAMPRPDARLPTGEDPLSDAVLARRSRADVEPRGVAITQILLTDPSSALYRPAYREELYEIARAALFASGTSDVASTEPLRR
jgi:hypothetical protein